MNKLCPYLLNRPHFGDALQLAQLLPDESINCIVTSPPYWQTRDYGVEGQWGLEDTPGEYVERLTVLFRELRRALRSDGTLWINIGDCYCSSGAPRGVVDFQGRETQTPAKRHTRPSFRRDLRIVGDNPHRAALGLKPKDLVGIPWMLAFSLRDDGWWLRSENIWHKTNSMPDAVKDRPTKAHEQIFLLTKSASYWYDADAVKVPTSDNTHARGHGVNPKAAAKSKKAYERAVNWRRRVEPRCRQNPSFSAAISGVVLDRRNLRSVWTFPTQPYSGAHYATFPEALPTTCILAGCPKDGVVLDPFLGSGTVGQVAQRLGRHWIGFDLDPKNVPLIERRTAQRGLFS